MCLFPQTNLWCLLNCPKLLLTSGCSQVKAHLEELTEGGRSSPVSPIALNSLCCCCSDSCPLSRCCHPTIASSVVPFSSSLQSFPASGSFPVIGLFAAGGQSIGASASASVLPLNTQDWSPLGWTGWISLQSKGLSRSFPTPQFKTINSLVLTFLHDPTLTSIHDLWKNHNFN